MSIPTTLRRATKADLPRMTRMLIDAFAPGPWGRYLFPPHLNTKSGDEDEYTWRLHTITAGFDSPARDTVLACQGKEEGEEIVGWAQWVDLAPPQGGGLSPREEMKAKMDRDLGPNPAGLDTAALATLQREGQLLEKRFEEALGAEHVLSYLVIDPKHQRKGLGRLLVKEGLGRAASQGRDVCLRSTPEGRPLYLALGFEEICEQKVIGESQYAMVMKVPGLVRTA